MSTSATLIDYRLKRFNCRITAKSTIHIKHVENANHTAQKHPNKHQDYIPSKLRLFGKGVSVLLFKKLANIGINQCHSITYIRLN